MSLEELVALHSAGGEAIYRLARREGIPGADAEDVRQAALAAAWGKRAQCSASGSPLRWLLGFGRLEVLKWKEGQSRRLQGEVADRSRIAAEQSWSSQAGGVEAAQEAQRLLGGVRRLNERHRFLVEARVLEGLSARRIAELETSSVQSVHRGLAKAVKALRTRAGIGTARRKTPESGSTNGRPSGDRGMRSPSRRAPVQRGQVPPLVLK